MFLLAGKLAEAQRTIAEDRMGQVRSRRSTATVEAMAQRIEQLEDRTLLLESMLAKLTETPLSELRATIDASFTGVANRAGTGAFTRETTSCPSCTRPVNRKLNHCQICGTQVFHQ